MNPGEYRELHPGWTWYRVHIEIPPGIPGNVLREGVRLRPGHYRPVSAPAGLGIMGFESPCSFLRGDGCVKGTTLKQRMMPYNNHGELAVSPLGFANEAGISSNMSRKRQPRTHGGSTQLPRNGKICC